MVKNNNKEDFQMRPPFFLTIDTEGDNIWSRPTKITSRNTEKLYRFQELCEKYHIKPIYLTNYEASINTEYVNFIEKHKKNLEVGLHLHAWNSPPIHNLTENDFYFQPYLHEYPEKIIIKKINYLTEHLKDVFQTAIISHRGGRYSINKTIFDSLYDNGIRIDCSVVPGIDWSGSKGDPKGTGGPDFRNFQSNINTLESSIIEIPVSTYRINKYVDSIDDSNIFKRAAGKIFNYKNSILRSKINNLEELKKIVNWNLVNNATHLEYIIHSSELVYNESPLIYKESQVDIFYNNLELFFKFLQQSNIESFTFKEYMKKKIDI